MESIWIDYRISVMSVMIIKHILFRIHILMVISVAVGNALSCPQPCACFENGAIARCILTTHRDYVELSKISNGIRSLTCVIEGVFNESAFEFIGEKEQLETLYFTTSSRMSLTWALWTNSISSLTRNNIFNGVRNLRHLGINIVLRNLNPMAFRGLPKLETLDLSETQLPDLKFITGVLDIINAAKLPIRSLRLRNIQGFQQGRSPSGTFGVKLNEAIYKHIDRLDTLRELDLRDNEVIEFEPGLSQHLPRLETLRLGIMTWMYFPLSSVGSYRDCSVLDILFHPNLKTFELILPNQIPSSGLKGFIPHDGFITQDDPVHSSCSGSLIQAFIAANTSHPNATQQICHAIDCFCDNSRGIPCDIIQQQLPSPKSILRTNCSLYMNIPLSESVERLVFRNYLLMSVSDDVTYALGLPTTSPISSCHRAPWVSY